MAKVCNYNYDDDEDERDEEKCAKNFIKFN